jgi:hypothetical protein
MSVVGKSLEEGTRYAEWEKRCTWRSVSSPCSGEMDLTEGRLEILRVRAGWRKCGFHRKVSRDGRICVGCVGGGEQRGGRFARVVSSSFK